jgi:phasin family protein
MPDTRKNQNETTRASVRDAGNEAEDAMRIGVANMQRIAEEFSRALGLSDQAKELTGRATQNLEAITESGSILARGFQEVSREWLELAQQRLQKNAQDFTKLAACRSVPDLAALQSDLLRENVEQVIDATRRIAERSIEIANEAGQKITAEVTQTTRRLSRAA